MEEGEGFKVHTKGEGVEGSARRRKEMDRKAKKQR
jgi:hypothetical protein